VLSYIAWLRRTHEDGGSAVEYGLLVAGIAGLIAAAVFLFGEQVGALFDNTCDSISSGASGQMGSVNC
jgi:pilus assembly protein Flp/PilA